MQKASLLWDEQGLPYATNFQDHYFSKNGGLEESRYVFINGNSLPQAWKNKETFTIAETGFGTGLNFLALWKLWNESSFKPKKLHFISIEGFPLDNESLKKSHHLWDELKDLSKELQEKYPPLVEGIHHIEFENGQIILTLGFGEALSVLPKFYYDVDAWFLDGFAPSRNDSLWNENVFSHVARLSHKGTTFATFTSASKVRKGLHEVGFDVSKREGFKGKREMCTGIYM